MIITLMIEKMHVLKILCHLNQLDRYYQYCYLQVLTNCKLYKKRSLTDLAKQILLKILLHFYFYNYSKFEDKNLMTMQKMKSIPKHFKEYPILSFLTIFNLFI